MPRESASARYLITVLLVTVLGLVATLICTQGDFAAATRSLQNLRWAPVIVTEVLLILACGFALSFPALLPLSTRGWFARTGFWLGKAAALFPITCLAWSFLGVWIGQHGHPIWTLMPVTEPAGTLPEFERWARWLWQWIPALALMAVPLTGQSICLQTEVDPTARRRGHLALAALALVLAVQVEDILGISGAGAGLAQAFRQADPLLRATAIWAFTLAALLPILVLLPPALRLLPEEVKGPLGWGRFLLGSLFKLSAWALALVGYFTLLPPLDPIASFDHPLPLLISGMKPMLCALSCWWLGHIIEPRNLPPPTPEHG